MDLYQTAKIVNLDALPDDAIIVASTIDSRLILSKAQLFKRLNASVARAKKPTAKATKAKSDKN